MSGQIFLYSSGGRTLWVPRHTPTANETKPVCMLSFATPMELSRSFYLFDYPVQVVENAQVAAMNPNAKTPNEVLAAVNDFRRLCAEDQSFLLQRCYNAQQSPQPQHQQQQQQQQQPQQHNYQGSYPQSMSSSSVGHTQSAYSGNSTNNTTYEANKPAGGTMDNAALLTQLLQQRQQQQPQQQQQMPMMGSGGGSYPDLTTGTNAYGGSYGDDSGSGGYYNSGRGGRGGRRMGMYNAPYTPDMMQQQQQPMIPMMMGGGYGVGNAGYGADPMMMYNNNSGMPYQRGRNGRRDGQMYGNYGNPAMMMMPQQQQMMMMGGGGRRGAAGGGMNAMPGQARMAPGARHEPEPITIDVAVPEDIKNVYMNPAQQLVIATMPGPHMTVWLREHPIPTDTQDKKYVFGKNGVILMLKAAFEEVKDSKPVELFPKQICTHFFIYGYCSRANCFHEHHSEQQLRELIAARHVQLKAMTKAQRHELIAEIEEKDKAGVAAAEAQREEREKRRAEAQAEREARRQARQQARDPQYQQQQQSQSQQQQQSSYSMPSSQPNPSQDIGSDNDDDTTTLGGQGSQSLADLMASSPSQDFAVNAATTADNGGMVEDTNAPAPAALAKLGITDSDDDDDDDDDAVSSSKSSGSAASEEGEAEAEAVVAPADDATPLEQPPVTASSNPAAESAIDDAKVPHEDKTDDAALTEGKHEDKEEEKVDNDAEAVEEAVEEEDGGDEGDDVAKKGKKRGRAPAPKKAAKRTKK